MDDHEVYDNYIGNTSEEYTTAVSVWNTYLGNGNPIREGVTYYNFTYGAVGVFVVDGRSYRDDDEHTILGDHQLQALKDWLLFDNSEVKIIATPVTMTETVPLNDTWYCCIDEKNDVLNFIKDNEISGVFALSADQHYVVASLYKDCISIGMY